MAVVGDGGRSSQSVGGLLLLILKEPSGAETVLSDSGARTPAELSVYRAQAYSLKQERSMPACPDI